MNAALDIIPLVDESALYQLITKARSIAHQMQSTTDDEEAEDLASDLFDLNDRIIRMRASTLEEVREKATYLLGALEIGDPFDAVIIEPLLRSLTGRAV